MDDTSKIVKKHGFTITNPPLPGPRNDSSMGSANKNRDKEELQTKYTEKGAPAEPPQDGKEAPAEPPQDGKEAFRISGFTIKMGNKPQEPMDVICNQEQDMLDNTNEHDPFEEMIEQWPGEAQGGVKAVLDAANIGKYGLNKEEGASHTRFDANKLLAAIEYFESRGVQTISFLPQAILRKRPGKNDAHEGNACMQTDTIDILNSLVVQKKVCLVPPGDDDDMYVLKYSRESNHFVVSNDFYSDHIRLLRGRNESLGASMALWIAENRCPYTFVGDTDFFPSPSSNLVLSCERHTAEVGAGKGLEVAHNTRIVDIETSLCHLSESMAITHRLHMQGPHSDDLKRALVCLQEARAHLARELGVGNDSSDT